MQQKPEVITLAEALQRIGLSDLLAEGDTYRAQARVGWTGYPKPFACGHTATRGFGPLAEGKTDADNDRNGRARRYQERVRISQEICDGCVLFEWARYAKSVDGSIYRLNSSAVVTVRATDDGHDTCLKLGFTG